MPRNVIVSQQFEQLRMTAELIKRDGRWLTLHRRAPGVSDGAGGTIQPPEGADPTIEPQFVYFGGKINNRQNNMPVAQDSAIGEFVRSTHVLVGMPVERFGLPANDIQKGDWFEIDGERYTVEFIHHNRGYQVKAEVRSMYS